VTDAETVTSPFGLRPLTDKEFARYQAFVEAETGIHLGPAKKALLVGRLARRLRELQLDSYGAYLQHVLQGDAQEKVRMLDCICTNETRFFREPRHFEYLEQTLFPFWAAEAAAGRRPRRIRVWSAACSTGEEPYSLAMVLWRHFPPAAGWDIEIVATDLSTKVLDRARAGIYPLEKASQIPQDLLHAFMLRGRGPQEGLMKVGPQVLSVVHFARVNLTHESYPVSAPFDLIFLRNVLIYFSQETKGRVLQRVTRHLVPGGHIFLGHAETVAGLDCHLRSVIPTVYAVAETPARSRPRVPVASVDVA
jgi:chemotaxis protein methyltransferase CheR